MKHSHPHRVTAASSSALRRDVRRSSTTKTIVPRTQVEEELQLAHVKLCNEVRQVQRAVEEERRRIARELHDEFGQALTGLKFDLAWLRRTLVQSPASIGGEALLNKVQAMSGSVDGLLASVHATAAALRPAVLDDLGLVPALKCLVTTHQDRTGARCAIDVAPGLVIHRAAIRNVCRVVSNRAGIVDERDASRLRFAGSHMAVPGRRQGDVRSN